MKKRCRGYVTPTEGCRGFDAEHNEMRKGEKQGKHRESKKAISRLSTAT